MMSLKRKCTFFFFTCQINSKQLHSVSVTFWEIALLRKYGSRGRMFRRGAKMYGLGGVEDGQLSYLSTSNRPWKCVRVRQWILIQCVSKCFFFFF